MEANPRCIYCGYEKTRKNGVTITGNQRYFCPKCPKSFVIYDGRSDGDAYKEFCKHCNMVQNFTKFGFNYAGNQRLKCVVCTRTKSITEKREE